MRRVKVRPHHAAMAAGGTVLPSISGLVHITIGQKYQHFSHLILRLNESLRLAGID
jgi:hypothetical protein